MGFLCGVDIGGTFTDCVAIEDGGRIVSAKAPSTPPDFERGFVDAVTAAAALVDLDLDTFLAQTNLLLHGTTVGTNILVQMRGARTGLLTTRGHGDALIMMRSYGRSAGLPIGELLHVSRHRKPEQIVPRARIKEVSERIDWAGDVVLDLNEAEARRGIEELVADGVDAIAISLLWGFVNPVHELRLKAMVRELAPDVFVTCAHELIVKPGEYERTAGTAINAFIGPSMARYVERVDQAVRARGYMHPLLIMQASGGAARAEHAVAKPLFTIGSGPVGGVAATGYLARTLGHENVIACDMGGTSFDVGIISAGEPLATTTTTINQYTFFMPRLDIESIGSGGGSILWKDEHSDVLEVGPQSAGALPGPASYGRGGERPTVTDCNLVLGRYGTERPLAAGLRLDAEAALRAVESVASLAGLEPVAAADGAVRIVDSQMADLLRQMTVERGLDPRDFVIYSFGGAGGLHAVAFARQLGCREVVVPLGDLASTFSALGVATSDVLHIHEASQLMLAPFSAPRLNETFERLEREARDQLREEGFADDDIDLARFAEMKFALQIHQVEVPVPSGTLGDDDALAQVDRFAERYERLYGEGTAFTDAGSQIGLLRVVARGAVRTPALPHPKPRDPAPAGSREVYWRELGGFTATAVLDGSLLGAGASIEAPAVIEFPSTTVLVPPGAEARVDSFGNVIIDVGEVPA